MVAHKVCVVLIETRYVFIACVLRVSGIASHHQAQMSSTITSCAAVAIGGAITVLPLRV
jgi:hypothetical protein